MSSLYKTWIVVFSMMLLHSMFPPRQILNAAESVGRSCIFSPFYDKANYEVLTDKHKKLGRHYAPQKMRGKALGDNSKKAVWNPATVNWIVYIVQLVLILSTGGLITMCLRLRRLSKESKS